MVEGDVSIVFQLEAKIIEIGVIAGRTSLHEHSFVPAGSQARWR